MRKIVILCSHNGEKYICDQIKSILNQETRVDFIHVHDFSSDDRTVEFVLEIAGNYNDVIRLCQHSDKPGPASSFIRALNLVDSPEEYIVFLADQDDIWLPHKVSTMMDLLSTENLDFAAHDVKIVDANLNVLKGSFYSSYWDISRDLNRECIQLANPIIGHTMVFRGDILKRLILIENKSIVMHDWWILFQILNGDYKIGFSNTQLSLYRQHENNILGSGIKNKFRIKRLRNHGESLVNMNLLTSEMNLVDNKDLLLNRSSLDRFKKLKPFRKFAFIEICLNLYFTSMYFSKSNQNNTARL